MIAMIDYGVGNLFSLSSSLTFLGLENTITDDPETIRQADRLILPGVGAFRDAYRKLEQTGLIDLIKAETAKGKPLLGICLGMQLLFEKSYEYGEYPGLGLIEGVIAPIADDLTQDLKVPHIGWNALEFPKADPLFKDVKAGDCVYYVHSFYAKGCEADTIAVSEYEIPITGAVRNGNICGTQFHPEKSGDVGLKILKAFAEI